MIKNYNIKLLNKIILTNLLILMLIPSLLFSQGRKIKPGDSIEIIVYGHEELSRTVFVSPQGTIDFPFMQSIPVDGQTLEKVRELVTAQLSHYLPTPPAVSAIFSGTASISVSVLGQVALAGVVQLPHDSRLQGALITAGKVLPGADLNAITLLRVENEKTLTNSYNLESFLIHGDLAQNPLLKDKDIIIVTGNPLFDQVKVLGEVNAPGTYNAFQGASILDLIFMAGGFTKEAKPSKIQFISLSEEKTMELEIDLSKYFKTPQSYSHLPKVKGGDVIMVPTKKSTWSTVWRVTKEILTVAQFLYWIALYQYYRDR
jgi:polysaccharide biosynthesis/export protein